MTDDGTRFAFRSTHVTSATGGTIDLMVARQGGDTVYTRTYPFTGYPLPRDSVELSLATTKDPAMRELERKNAPRFRSPVDHMVLGLDETLWLQRRSANGNTELVMLDNRGNPLIMIGGLPRAELAQANASTLWVIVRNEDDVPSIVRYHVGGKP